MEGTLALESETQALGVGPNTIRYQLCDLAISEPESVASSDNSDDNSSEH